MAKQATSTKSRQRSGRARSRRRNTWSKLGTYAVLGLTFAALAGLLIVISRGQDDRQSTAQAMSGPAPDFTLSTVSGEEVNLASYRSEKNVLLFFNEGYGCAPCWQQSVEIQDRLDELEAADTEYLVVMVDSPRMLASEIQRWGLTVPVLTDVDRRVSEAYKMLGFGMHADKPNHTFVFVDKSGEIRWWQDYASMRAPTDEVITKVERLATSAS